MPKSREFVENSSDSEEAKNLNKTQSESDAETAKTSASSKTKGKSSNNPPAKRAKTGGGDDDDGVASTTGPNGERLYEFGKLRFVSVNQFKGKPYINIREYYEDHGVQKPGKKGISLPADQWEKLKTLVNQVDKDLKKTK